MDAQPIGGSATELHDLLLHAEDLTDDLQECTATIASRLSTDGAPVWCAVTVVRHRQPAICKCGRGRKPHLSRNSR